MIPLKLPKDVEKFYEENKDILSRRGISKEKFVEMLNELKTELHDIITALYLNNPFLAILLLKFPIFITVDEDLVPIAASTPFGGIIINLINWFEKFGRIKEGVRTNEESVAGKTFVLGHEMMHLVLEHPLRVGKYNPVLWNIVCDAIVNSVLLARKTHYGYESEIRFIKPDVLRRIFKEIVTMDRLHKFLESYSPQNAEKYKIEDLMKMLPEEIIELFPKEVKELPKSLITISGDLPYDFPSTEEGGFDIEKETGGEIKETGGAGRGVGGAGGDSKGKGGGKGKDENEEKGKSKGEEKSRTKGRGKGGGKGGGKRRRILCVKEGSVGKKKYEENKTYDYTYESASSDVREVSRGIREEVYRAYQSAKMAGNLPLGLERVFERLLKPKVRWNTLLKCFIREAYGRLEQSTWLRPNRRGIPLIPGKIYLAQPRVWCLIDTSGSISEQELNQFISEVYAITQQLGVEVTVICWDAEAYEPVEARSPSDVVTKVARKIRGGGGTVIAPALRKTLKQMRRFDIVTVLTDGEIFDIEDSETQRLLQQVLWKSSVFVFVTTYRVPKLPSGVRVVSMKSV